MSADHGLNIEQLARRSRNQSGNPSHSSHPCNPMKPALFALVLALAGCSATPRSATPQPLVFADWTDRGEPWAACVVDLKRQLRDPDSYQDDWAEPTPKINDAARTVTYRWTFRARNGFGGYNAGRATCTNTLPAGASDPFGDARARVID